MLTIIENKDLIYDVFDYDVILVGTNTYCSLMNGFQYDVRTNFPMVNEVNKTTPYGDPRKMGTIRVVEDRLLFCLCYVAKGYNFQPHKYKEYLDYDALETCISLINENFKNKKIATTVMGASKFDGNGDKEKILKILEDNSSNINLYVYDYEQKARSEKYVEEWKEITMKKMQGELTRSEAYKLKGDILWKKAHGIYNPCLD